MDVLFMVSLLLLRMSGGTHSRHGRNPPEEDLLPSSKMAQVLQDIETNRLRSEHLLERVAQNTEPREIGRAHV